MIIICFVCCNQNSVTFPHTRTLRPHSEIIVGMYNCISLHMFFYAHRGKKCRNAVLNLKIAGISRENQKLGEFRMGRIVFAPTEFLQIILFCRCMDYQKMMVEQFPWNSSNLFRCRFVYVWLGLSASMKPFLNIPYHWPSRLEMKISRKPTQNAQNQTYSKRIGGEDRPFYIKSSLPIFEHFIIEAIHVHTSHWVGKTFFVRTVMVIFYILYELHEIMQCL